MHKLGMACHSGEREKAWATWLRPAEDVSSATSTRTQPVSSRQGPSHGIVVLVFR